MISAPFFLAAAYFSYLLVASVIEYLLKATFGEWLSALPGMLVLPIVGSAILAPGLFLASRESVVINLALGVIGKRREFLGLHTKGKMINLDDIEQIVCRTKTRKHTDRSVGSTSGRTSSTTFYLIDLEVENGKMEPLIEYSDKSIARNITREIGEFTNVRVDNRL